MRPFDQALGNSGKEKHCFKKEEVFMGADHISNSVVQPVNGFYLCHQIRGNKQAFQLHKIYCREALLTTEKQSTQHKMPYCLC